MKALLAVGALVIRLSEKGAPDLLVLFRGSLFLLECKSRLGGATMAQEQRSQQGWPVSTVRTVEDALGVLFGKDG